MLTIYGIGEKGLTKLPADASVQPGQEVVWIDLLEPTHEEEHLIQDRLGIEVPTQEEMKAIEVSSRLYEENGAIYMTASVLVHAESSLPKTSEITFILTQGKVVTVRYADPLPFAMFLQRVAKQSASCGRGENVFVGLVEAIVDRLADLLERAGEEIDTISNRVFRHNAAASKSGRPMRARAFDRIIAQIGQTNDLTSKARESLISIARMVTYLSGSEGIAIDKLPKDVRIQLKTAMRDVQQLSDHASYLSNKIAFLLDAVTGLITIEQNNIIKLFSVVAVALMPPTLIASIYGMNFKVMPELEQWWGYPTVLAVMIGSAILPFLYFRRRGWL